jgi:hypothetical protein
VASPFLEKFHKITDSENICKKFTLAEKAENELKQAGTHLGCCQRASVRCCELRVCCWSASGWCAARRRANQSGVSPFWNPDRECEDGTVRAAWRQQQQPPTSRVAPDSPWPRRVCTFERGWGSVDVCGAARVPPRLCKPKRQRGAGVERAGGAVPRRRVCGGAARQRAHAITAAPPPLAADPRARQSRPWEAEHEQPIGGTRWTTACAAAAAADGHRITRRPPFIELRRLPLLDFYFYCRIALGRGDFVAAVAGVLIAACLDEFNQHHREWL